MPTSIGRYEIRDEIGRGAFGRVFRAFDPQVNRHVAVKVLNTIDDPSILVRFRNEAAAAGGLNHRNIVTVHDFGEHDGAPYIVMELVDGSDLQTAAVTRRLSLLEKMEIMSQVAAGLHYAHHKGVIHRDVKPANIMVLPDRTVKILDFGIARLEESTAPRQTRTGFLVGTILYMSPEQFREGKVDSLCDIWAYGVIYYEMLTGRHPFEAKDNASLMYKISHADPQRIRELAPECPEALERIVHRALARDRELRYQTLDDLQLDTEPLLTGLRRERADGMLAEARDLLETGQLDAAQSMVRRILDLDPANSEGRQLRDQISRLILGRSVRPRVESLQQTAEREIAGRHFTEALEALDAALRLDPENPGLRERLDVLKRLMADSARAAELAAQAEREFSLDFAAAQRHCGEALQLDPSHPVAERLAAAIREEIARRDDDRLRQAREGEITRLAGQATELAGRNRFEAALAIIGEGLRKYGGDGRLARLSQAVNVARTAYDQRQALTDVRSQPAGIPAAPGVEPPIPPPTFGIAQPESDRGRPRPVVLVALGIAAVICTCLFFWLFGSGDPEPKSIPAAVSGQPYTTMLPAGAGTPPVVWSIERGSLPPGLALDAKSGRIEGDPGKEGVYPFVVKESDANGRVEQQAFTLAVQPAPPLTVTMVWDRPNAERGAPYSGTVHAEGGLRPYRWRIDGTLPRGLQLDSGTGQITGTPLEEGNFSFVAEVSDRNGKRAQRTFRLTSVNPAAVSNPAPAPTQQTLIVAAKMPAQAILGQSFTASFSVPGSSGALNWSAEPLPPGLKMYPGRALLVGKPTKTGTYRFTVHVKDRAGHSGQGRFELVVLRGDKPSCAAFDLGKYDGPRAGTLKWAGVMSAGSILSIDGPAVSLGAVGGARPPYGVPVNISVAGGLGPSLILMASPSAADCWTGPIKLFNGGSSVVKGATITWWVYQP